MVRRIDISSGAVTTLAGQPVAPGHANGVGTQATFNYPYDVATDAAGTFTIVADDYNHLIRHIDMQTLVVTTLAGKANVAGRECRGLCVMRRVAR